MSFHESPVTVGVASGAIVAILALGFQGVARRIRDGHRSREIVRVLFDNVALNVRELRKVLQARGKREAGGKTVGEVDASVWQTHRYDLVRYGRRPELVRRLHDFYLSIEEVVRLQDRFWNHWFQAIASAVPGVKNEGALNELDKQVENDRQTLLATQDETLKLGEEVLRQWGTPQQRLDAGT